MNMVSGQLTIPEAKQLLPRLLDDPGFRGTLVVEDAGRPCLALLDGSEYQRYLAWRQRDAMRAHILSEMRQRRGQPAWGQGFRFFAELRERASNLSDERVIALVDEAVTTVRKSI